MMSSHYTQIALHMRQIVAKSFDRMVKKGTPGAKRSGQWVWRFSNPFDANRPVVDTVNH
jgi:hypothetical protein